MIDPFFSVVIPTYNRKNILPKAISSVLSQTYKNFELIIVDNGSTDGTNIFLSEIYKNDEIIYHYQKGSGSPASPRNTGISLAKGKWICFLDSDDLWDKEKLQCIFDSIKRNTNIDVICHYENIMNDDGECVGKVLKSGPYSSNMYKDMLLFGNRLSTSATSIRAKFINDNNLKFNESNKFAMVEDYDLWLNLANHKANFLFLSDVLGFYVIGKSNMILNSSRFCKNLTNLLKFHVYSVQDFSEDKDKLWKLLRLRSDMCKVQHFDISAFKKIISIFFMFIKHPVNFSTLTLGYINKKICTSIK